jgi:hypothetical protein
MEKHTTKTEQRVFIKASLEQEQQQQQSNIWPRRIDIYIYGRPYIAGMDTPECAT